jgi:HSP20 family protein
VPVRREDNPLVALQRDMNRVFEEFWRGFDLPTFDDGWGAFSPQVDVEETDDEVRVAAELPGIEAKDLEVTVSDDALVLKGEKREEREARAGGWRECSYGAFERAVPLPCEVDAGRAAAEFKNGVLRVRLPKSATARERSRRIEIATA